MKTTGFRRYFTLWSVFGGLGLAAILLGLFTVLLRAATAAPEQPPEPTPVLVVIPAPTSTPPAIPTVPPTPSATPGGDLSTPQPNESIKIGDYVQITGTGGDGLRIRSGPGTQNSMLFLGNESEVFEVVAGPTQADGFSWWNLKAPYDDSRKGWAASNYLVVIAKRP